MDRAAPTGTEERRPITIRPNRRAVIKRLDAEEQARQAKKYLNEVYFQSGNEWKVPQERSKLLRGMPS